MRSGSSTFPAGMPGSTHGSTLSNVVHSCQESDITDPEFVELCMGIVESQQQEISQMQSILERYDSD